MPVLEIKQNLNYQSSPLENTLEEELDKYGVCLHQPALLGQRIEDIKDGIIRELTRGNRFLCYHKFFQNENEFLRKSDSGLTPNIYIDETKLLDILNLNKLYSEDIRMAEGSTGIALVHCPSSKEFKIDFTEEKGIELFTRVVSDFYNYPVNQKQLEKKIHYCTTDRRSNEIGVKEIGKIITPYEAGAHFFKIDDYVAMFIKYYFS